jgi:copper(I)-binding protein
MWFSLGIFLGVHLSITRRSAQRGYEKMKNSFWIRLAAALGIAVLLIACQEQAEESAPVSAPVAAPVFEDAWVRAMPPGAKMTAAYGVLRNESDAAVTLDAFASASFRDVSLHRTEQVDGVARMREVESVTLQPGERLQLEPGGYHLMLMGPTAPLAIGATVPIEMAAEDGRSFHFEVSVERR